MNEDIKIKIMQRNVSEEERRDKARWQMLQQYPDGSGVVHPASYRVTRILDDIGIHRALDDLAIISPLIEVLFKNMTGHTMDLYLYEKLYKTRRDIIRSMCTSRPYEIYPDVLELMIDTLLPKKREIQDIYDRIDQLLDQLKPSRIEDNDPAPVKWDQSGRRLPYRIWKFMEDKKLPKTESARGICVDFRNRWREIESKITILREAKEPISEAQWEDIFTKKSELMKQWETALLVVSGRNYK